MINQPWFFDMFWKLVHPFLDPVTAGKVHMVGDLDKHSVNPLMTHFDADQLCQWAGGTSPFNYHWQTHYDMEDRYQPPRVTFKKEHTNL